MLTEARFTAFKALRDVCVPLQPFTVLIGPNGVGKSSALDGIHYLLQVPAQTEGAREYRCGPLDVFFAADRSPSYLLSHDSDGRFGIEVREAGRRFGFMATCERRENAQWDMVAATLEVEEAGRIQRQEFPRQAGDNPYLLLQQAFPRRLTNAVRLRLDAEAIKEPSPAAGSKPRMRYSGKGLPTLLNHIITQRDERIEKIEAAMAKLVRGFKRVYTEECTIETFDDQLIRIDDETLTRRVAKQVNGFALAVGIGRGRVPAAHLSEGTLLLLAMLTLVYSEKRPPLVLLDDIDRALHPQAQVELVELLRELCRIEENLQIIATAHSIMTVSQCRKEEVVELEFDQNQHTVAKIIDDSPLVMTPSEIVQRYFGIHRTGASELLQHYALLANDPARDDDADQRVKELRGLLRRDGIEPGWEPVARIQKPS